MPLDPGLRARGSGRRAHGHRVAQSRILFKNGSTPGSPAPAPDARKNFRGSRGTERPRTRHWACITPPARAALVPLHVPERASPSARVGTGLLLLLPPGLRICPPGCCDEPCCARMLHPAARHRRASQGSLLRSAPAASGSCCGRWECTRPRMDPLPPTSSPREIRPTRARALEPRGCLGRTRRSSRSRARDRAGRLAAAGAVRSVRPAGWRRDRAPSRRELERRKPGTARPRAAARTTQPEGATWPFDADRSGLSDELARPLADLPDVARACLLLHVVIGHSFTEIATLLDIPENTAASHARRARLAMRTALTSSSFDPTPVPESP
jgi:DNA-directed RNA polymerase specialized sigma24 family protein